MAEQSSNGESKRHQDAKGRRTFRRLRAAIPALLMLAVGHFVTVYFSFRQQAFGEKTSISQGLTEAAKRATEIVLSRRKAYDDAGQLSTFYQRGIGYLYERHDMVLLATLPSVSMGRSVVRIDNVKRLQTDCELWSMWARVAGPEIFAGTADAVDDGGSCHWEFTYFADTPGEYVVDVKILMYNGKAPQPACPKRTDKDVPFSQYGFSYGFIGFRMYGPEQACCEVCSRTPNCRYWVTPPLSFDLPGGALRQGCELFFDKEEDALLFDAPSNRSFHVVQLNRTHVNPSSAADVVGRLEKVIAHGSRPAVPSSGYFLSCGWSFWFSFDFPCLDIDIDDSIHVYPNRTFTVVAPVGYRSKDDARPLCRIETDERLHDPNASLITGRWVREPFPDNEACPNAMEIDTEFSKSFDIMKLDGERPHCWHRDDLSIIGRNCIEFCNIPYTAGWISPLHTEKNWYGRWQPYRCELVDLTDEELQRCVDVRKIASIATEGASIAAFLKEYLDQRLSSIKLVDATVPGATRVVLNTFAFPHMLWNGLNSPWEQMINEFQPPGDNEEMYWVTGFYYSSEREPFVTVRRAEQLNAMLSERLPKGYRVLEAYDMTAAFSFDTATQMDGLHIIGPPAKMVITKLFHYMCADILGKQPSASGVRSSPRLLQDAMATKVQRDWKTSFASKPGALRKVFGLP